jgi:hypothetical protein
MLLVWIAVIVMTLFLIVAYVQRARAAKEKTWESSSLTKAAKKARHESGYAAIVAFFAPRRFDDLYRLCGPGIYVESLPSAPTDLFYTTYVEH